MRPGFRCWGGIVMLVREIWTYANEVTRLHPRSSTTNVAASLLNPGSQPFELGARKSSPSELASTSILASLNSLALDPGARMAPGRELKRLRTGWDDARPHTAAGADRGAAEGVHAATVRFVDDAVAGLLRFARATVDWDADPRDEPVACVAIGDYACAQARDQPAGSLLLLLEGRGYRRARSEAVAGFIVHGLTDLGIEVATCAMTVSAAAAMLAGPALIDRAAKPRLIAGKTRLFAEFESLLSAAEKK